MSVVLASKRISVLAEGPHWDEASQTLLFVDIMGNDCCRLDPKTGITEAVHFDGKFVTAVVPCTSSNCREALVSVDKNLLKLDWSSKNTKETVAIEANMPGTRFNDGKCDAKGRLWIGTMPVEFQPGVFEEGAGAFYSVDSDFKVTRHLKNITISNGLAWSLDNRTLFYIDSYPRQVYAFDYDLEAGTISSQRVVADFTTNEEYKECGMPDGMTIDAEGKLWIACFDGWRVIRIDPETGRILKSVQIPAQKVSSCCFGGPNYDELYVTSMWYGMSDFEKKNQPEAGGVFRVTELGVKGLPPYNFSG